MWMLVKQKERFAFMTSAFFQSEQTVKKQLRSRSSFGK